MKAGCAMCKQKNHNNFIIKIVQQRSLHSQYERMNVGTYLHFIYNVVLYAHTLNIIV